MAQIKRIKYSSSASCCLLAANMLPSMQLHSVQRLCAVSVCVQFVFTLRGKWARFCA